MLSGHLGSLRGPLGFQLQVGLSMWERKDGAGVSKADAMATPLPQMASPAQHQWPPDLPLCPPLRVDRGVAMGAGAWLAACLAIWVGVQAKELTKANWEERWEGRSFCFLPFLGAPFWGVVYKGEQIGHPVLPSPF